MTAAKWIAGIALTVAWFTGSAWAMPAGVALSLLVSFDRMRKGTRS